MTRTSIFDMAASVARVEMMLCVFKGSSILITGSEHKYKGTTTAFANSLCDFLAGGGYFAVLMWAQANIRTRYH